MITQAMTILAWVFLVVMLIGGPILMIYGWTKKNRFDFYLGAFDLSGVIMLSLGLYIRSLGG